MSRNQLPSLFSEEAVKQTVPALNTPLAAPPLTKYQIAARKRAQDPKWLAKRKAAGQKNAQDPVWRAKMKAAHQKMAQNPEWRANQKAAMVKRSQNPEWREKMKAAGRKRSQDPEWRAKMKAVYQDPGWIANQKAAHQKLAQDPEYRAKMKALYQDPEYRAKMKAAGQKRAQDPEWRANQKAGAQKNAQDPEWRANQKAGAQDPECRTKISLSRSKAIREGRLIIPSHSRGISGVHYSPKLQDSVAYRSKLELHWYRKLDQDPTVERYVAEPVTIKFRFQGFTRRYHPDILIFFKNGEELLVEVKPKWNRKTIRHIAQWTAASKWCKKRGRKFQIWSDKDVKLTLEDILGHE